jgi:hypothetical protein
MAEGFGTKGFEEVAVVHHTGTSLSTAILFQRAEGKD